MGESSPLYPPLLRQAAYVRVRRPTAGGAVPRRDGHQTQSRSDFQMAVNHTVRQEPLRAGTLYPLRLFMRYTGMQKAAMRTARDNGLKVRRVGTRAFVLADDFFAYLDSLQERTDSNDSKE